MADLEEKIGTQKLYNELQQLLAPYEKRKMEKCVDAADFGWETVENQLLMRSDAVAELGGGNLPAVSGMLFFEAGNETADSVGATQDHAAERMKSGEETARTREHVPIDKPVTLYGADLPELSGDVPYARIALVSLKSDFLTEEFKLYNLLRSIEYIRYHVSPKGYMPRISTAQIREQVRVSRDAVAQGLDFFKVGRSYADAYLKHPAVAAVNTVFITLPEFDYRALQGVFDRAEQRIMTLDHPLNNLKMDCNSCNLKAVCDEVEKLCGTGSR